jgi:hypothetical protein
MNTLSCQSCQNNRLMRVNAKCNDLCGISLDSEHHNGYVPTGLNIGSGDCIEFFVCAHCGVMRGTWPLPTNIIDQINNDNDNIDELVVNSNGTTTHIPDLNALRLVNKSQYNIQMKDNLAIPLSSTTSVVPSSNGFYMKPTTITSLPEPNTKNWEVVFANTYIENISNVPSLSTMNHCCFNIKGGNHKGSCCGVLTTENEYCSFHRSVIERDLLGVSKLWEHFVRPNQIHSTHSYETFPKEEYDEYHSWVEEDDE